MKKAIMWIVMSLAAACVSAQTFTVGGITYSVLADSPDKCEVTWPDEGSYRGDMAVPAQVDWQGATYRVAGVGEYAFAGSVALRSVSLPSGIVYMGRNAFQGCTALETFAMPPSVREIEEQTFYGCSSLKNFATSSATSIGAGAFALCTNLKIVYFGSDLAYVGDGAFKGCRALTTVTFPKPTVLGSGVFESCTALETATLPAELEVLPEYTFSGCTGLKAVRGTSMLREIGEYAFYSCEALESIIFGNRLSSIGRSAFGLCSSLDVRTISGDDLTIAEYAFSDCTGITELELNGVVEIGEQCFVNVSALTKLTLGASLTTIRESAFRGCGNIQTVTSLSLLPPFMQRYSFDEDVYKNALLQVAFGASLLYRQTPPWSYFVHVGELPEAAVEAVIADGAQFFTIDGRVLTVSGVDGPVGVYAADGRRIFEGDISGDSVTVTLPETGIYIVRVRGKAEKLMAR